jgi:hypothetical protein
MQKTINQFLEELRKNGRSYTGSRIRQIIAELVKDDKMKEGRDFIKIHSRLIMINGNGINKIKRRLKIL